MKTFKSVRIWVTGLFVAAGVALSSPALANPQQVRGALIPVEIPPNAQITLKFAQITNQLVAQCRQTGQVDRNLIQSVERQVPGLVKRVLQNDDEVGAFDVLVDGVNRLTLVIYACGV